MGERCTMVDDLELLLWELKWLLSSLVAANRFRFNPPHPLANVRLSTVTGKLKH
jgi:hypothetical protein